MSKAISLTRTHAPAAVELLRGLFVIACGTALLAAGQILPL